MLTQIKRSYCLKKYSQFPTIDNYREEYFYPKLFKSSVLTVESKSIKGHISLLSKEIIKLLKVLSIDVLIFLGDSKTPWLYQENDYKPVQEAIQYMIDNEISEKFNGALQVDNVDLPYFLKHLFWLQRCNAALPDFYFMDKGQNILGHICQYGHLHLGVFNTSTDKLLSNVFNKSKFELISDKCSS